MRPHSFFLFALLSSMFAMQACDSLRPEVELLHPIVETESSIHEAPSTNEPVATAEAPSTAATIDETMSSSIPPAAGRSSSHDDFKDDISLPVIGPRGIAYPSYPTTILPGGGGGGGGKHHRVKQDDDKKKHEAEKMTWLLHWNEMAINASGIDHELNNIFNILSKGARENFGPSRAARALAIVHIAIFEALNAIEGGYESYIGLPRAEEDTNLRAALAQAAHDSLVATFPAQATTFALQLAHDLDEIGDSQAEQRGIELGKRAARTILRMRQDDGSDHPEPLIGEDFITSNDPGKWRMDPISQRPAAMGAHWDAVDPFVIESASQFRAPPPPALDSDAYTRAFNEVKRLGGDGVITPTERTEEQTEIGLYWAYDGTPSLCAPPKLYNQLATHVAQQMHTSFMDTARLLALINVAMADAALAIWESKFLYQVWRPITAIREADPGTGPSGLGDGNPLTEGDINFTPLGAPASNESGPDFTPPFPAYPSGHAGFGGAIFEIMRQFFGRDDVEFTFISEELDGLTLDSRGMKRPFKPRTYSSFSEAEEENGQSRIYLGIHWEFDKTEGIKQGRLVGDYVIKNVFTKMSTHK